MNFASPRVAVFRRYSLAAWIASAGFYTAVILHKAWVSDDAYITFRTVDNFLHGYGLTWNVGERVQAYTHPLWMLIFSAVTAITRETYVTALTLGALLSILTVVWISFRFAANVHVAILGVVLLSCSRALTDYSTSGLENPLTHLLLALFVWSVLGCSATSRSSALVAFLAALCLLCRLDTFFLIVPAFAWVCLQRASRRTLWSILLGLTPLLVWEAFSLLYYGMPIANSAYAKLNTAIPKSQLVAQGLRYLGNSLHWDPVTLFGSALGGLLPFLVRDREGRFVSAGIFLHLAYVVAVGGDFMSGRFLSAPFLLGVLLIVRTNLRKPVAWTAAVVIAGFHLAVPSYSPFQERDYGTHLSDAIDAHGIADERAIYLRISALQNAVGQSIWPAPRAATQAERARTGWVDDGVLVILKRLRIVDPGEDWPPHESAMQEVQPLLVRGAVGFEGFYLGQGMHILDLHGLADPLLARLPALRPDPLLETTFPHLAHKSWRIGHFTRRVPRGYVETLGHRENRIADPTLATYYDKLARITQGRLWEAKRLQTIVNLNLGRYDHLLEAYRRAAASTVANGDGKALEARNP